MNSILVYFGAFDLFLCTYIVGKEKFGLKASILNPIFFFFLNIDLKLVKSKIFSIIFLVAMILLSHINVEFRHTSIQLNLSKSLSKNEG